MLFSCYVCLFCLRFILFVCVLWKIRSFGRLVGRSVARQYEPVRVKPLGISKTKVQNPKSELETEPTVSFVSYSIPCLFWFWFFGHSAIRSCGHSVM